MSSFNSQLTIQHHHPRGASASLQALSCHACIGSPGATFATEPQLFYVSTFALSIQSAANDFTTPKDRDDGVNTSADKISCTDFTDNFTSNFLHR